MRRTSKPLSPRSRTISIAVPSGRCPKTSRMTCGICDLSICVTSILNEWFDIAASAEHKGIRDMGQRRQIDIGHAVGDQFDEAPIDPAIFRLLLVDEDVAIMDEMAAAGRQRQPPGVGVDADIPGLRTGLAPVEFRADRET